MSQTLTTKINYHSVRALSGSGLIKLKKSPKHFKYWLENPKEPTKEMQRGTALHCLILEPQEFSSRYAIYDIPDVHKNSNQWKIFVAAQKARNKIALTIDEFEELDLIKRTLYEKSLVRTTLNAPGQYEKEFYWSEDGIAMKGKLDKWLPDHNLIIDYKSTACAEPEKFQESSFFGATSLGYHIKCAQYQAALEKEGIKPQFWFIAQETEPPYESCIFEPDQEFLEAGIREREELKLLYKKCMETNNWPGYPEDIVKLSIARWKK